MQKAFQRNFLIANVKKYHINSVACIFIIPQVMQVPVRKEAGVVLL